MVTASSTSANVPLLVAGMFSGASETDTKAMRRFGRAVGVAFQISDDIIDIASLDSGKTPGTDLRAGVATLPVLYTLAEGLRVVSVLLHAFMPGSAGRLLAALGREDLRLDGAALGRVEGGATVGELGQLLPRVEPAASAA